MLRHTGEPRQVRTAAHCNDQVVVGNVVEVGMIWVADDNMLTLYVDCLDLSLVEVSEPGKTSDRVHNMRWLDAAGYYFCQHRL